MTTATPRTTPSRNGVYILPLNFAIFVFSCTYWSQKLLNRQRSNPNENTSKLLLSFAFSKIRRAWLFHVVFVQRTAKNSTNIYNGLAQPVFYSLNLQFGGVLIALAVVVCLSSLLSLRTLKFEFKVAWEF